METSLYSLVSDVVIVEVGSRIVFVIKVKSPELNNGEVFTSRRADPALSHGHEAAWMQAIHGHHHDVQQDLSCVA